MKQFLSVVSFLFIVEGIESGEKEESLIILSSSKATDENHMVKNVNDTLELACMSNQNQSVGWVLPKHVQDRALHSKGVNGSAKVTVNHLLENDTGEYKCGLHSDSDTVSCSLHDGCTNHNYSSFAIVHLYVKKKKCLGFQCSPAICISERYICDGRDDCLNKEDESPRICGADPCLNKIRCNDRCIPQEWCCLREENCTRKWNLNCCPNSGSSLQDSSIMKYLGSPQHYNDHFYKQYNNSSITFFHNDLGDFSLLQTLIHTLIGCALVLVVIGPIIVIGVCRLYMRQRSYHSCIQGTSLFAARRMTPRRSNHFTAVTYHSSPHTEIVPNQEFHSFVLDQGEATVERNNSAGILYHNLGCIPPEEPPPYYEAIYSHQDDDQPPPYVPKRMETHPNSPSYWAEHGVGDEQETQKIANV